MNIINRIDLCTLELMKQVGFSGLQSIAYLGVSNSLCMIFEPKTRFHTNKTEIVELHDKGGRSYVSVSQRGDHDQQPGPLPE